MEAGHAHATAGLAVATMRLAQSCNTRYVESTASLPQGCGGAVRIAHGGALCRSLHPSARRAAWVHEDMLKLVIPTPTSTRRVGAAEVSLRALVARAVSSAGFALVAQTGTSGCCGLGLQWPTTCGGGQLPQKTAVEVELATISLYALYAPTTRGCGQQLRKTAVKASLARTMLYALYAPARPPRRSRRAPRAVAADACSAHERR